MANRTNKMQRAAVIAIVAAWLTSLVLCFIVAPRILLSAYDGESFEWLNQKIAAHRAAATAEALAERDRDWYLKNSERYAYRLAVFATAAAVFSLGVVFRRSVFKAWKGYLFSPDYALNLGVLRMVVFATLARMLWLLSIEKVASLPADALVWPKYSRFFLWPVPIDPDFTNTALPIATASALLAAIGLGTRFFALVALLLGGALMGVTSLSGKVDHTHHVLLIAAILVCSRCGDGFSVDSLIRRLRLRTLEGRRAADLAYGVPLRMVTVVLALCYFFPGFWKLCEGPGWVFGSALINISHGIWFQRETFTPLVRVDQLGPLVALGGIGTIVFELFFLPALLNKWTRYAFALIGQMFHFGIKLTLGIWFWSLQVMYVVFVDFHYVLSRVRELLGIRELTIYYDGGCGLCRRTMNVLTELDCLGVLRIQDAMQIPKDDPLLDTVDEADLLVDMHGLSNGAAGARVTRGYDTYQQIATRVPLLWPVAPLLFLPPISTVGRMVYRRVADSRACAVNTKSPPAEAIARRPWNPVPALVVFGLITLGMLETGFTKSVASWPVACYPTFASPGSSFTLWPIIEVTTEDGQVLELDDDPIREHYNAAAYVQVLRKFILPGVKEESSAKLLREMLPLWRASGDLPADAKPTELRVYVARYDYKGVRRPASPTTKELLHTFDWRAIESGAE